MNVAGQQHNAISLSQLLGGDHNDTSKQARRIPNATHAHHNIVQDGSTPETAARGHVGHVGGRTSALRPPRPTADAPPASPAPHPAASPHPCSTAAAAIPTASLAGRGGPAAGALAGRRACERVGMADGGDRSTGVGRWAPAPPCAQLLGR